MTSEHTRRGRRRLTATVTDLEVRLQRAFLVGVELPGMTTVDAERSLDELALLTDTAGSEAVDRERVRKDRPDAATFIGSGKAEELAALVRALDIDVVVFDNDLTPAQQRNLQRLFECDVVDREALILDIFAQHAVTKEGALQVELALLRYHLPRLRGRGKELGQQGAGIGTRGPGETRLETDRRRILARISKLERELRDTTRHRSTQRKARWRSSIPQVAIVGYTNAGKSTLLNRLTNAGVLVEDRLFATLDPTVRRLELPNGKLALVADTVGFVRRLPHHLVQAFRSTLSEVAEADLLLHLVDGTDPEPRGQIAAVAEVLGDIEASQIPQLLVVNKTDVLAEETRHRLMNLYPDAVMISALTGAGIPEMLARLGELLERRGVTLTLAIPYERGDILADAHRSGEVIATKHDDRGTLLEVRFPEIDAARFAEFAV